MPLRFDDPRQDEDSLKQRFLAALAVSLLVHISVVAIAQLGTTLHWWDAQPFSIFRKVRLTPEEIAKIQERERQKELEAQKEEPPTLTFVQVTNPSDEPPPDPKHYSSASSRAANPEPSNLSIARIDGKNAQTLRTEDTPRTLPGRSAASPPPTPPASASTAQVATPPPPPPAPPARTEPVVQAVIPDLTPRQPEPERVPGVGELALATPKVEPPRPEPVPNPPTPNSTPTPATPAPPSPTTALTAPASPVTPAPTPATPNQRPRPRSVVEAKLRQELLAGEKSKQAGGVARKGPVQLDVKGTPFGAYDEAIVLAVQARWFALLDEKRFAGGVTGRVVVQFKLYSDGSVRIVEPQDSSVDALYTAYCVRAVRDPAPYEKWPAEMTRLVGSNFREMRFTFFYN